MLSDAHDRAAFEGARHEFEDALAIIRAGETDPAHRALIEKIATGYQTFLAIDQLILDAVQHGETALSANLATGAEQLDAAFTNADAESLSMLEQRDAATAVKRFAATTRAARRAAWVLGAIGALSVIVLSAVITRAIRNPLTQVQEAAVHGKLRRGRVLAGHDARRTDPPCRLGALRREGPGTQPRRRERRQQLSGQPVVRARVGEQRVRSRTERGPRVGSLRTLRPAHRLRRDCRLRRPARSLSPIARTTGAGGCRPP